MEHTEFIRRIGSTVTTIEPITEEAVHAHFDIEGSQRLFLRELTSPEAAVVYLGHRILENPSDLRSHVQRILLLIEQGPEADLQGALTDIYIALGDKGGPLKQRLLILATPFLSRTAVAFFRQRSETGLKPWDTSVSRIRASLLSLGFSGSIEVVRRHDQVATAGYADALEEARSYIEYGQVDAAREVLEQALRLDPGSEAIAAELLEIYQYTRDDERLAVMRDYLHETLQQLPAGWAADNDCKQ